ncbi:hypothetical protein, partial [Aeromonas caviae]|uniref:hypothetical protein n=1 Tax=Aeromonas caviae TaxID=648 RepID=UPI001CC41A0C
YDARRQQGDGGGVFGDSQFTSTLSVNFHFPKIPRRTLNYEETQLIAPLLTLLSGDSGLSCPPARVRQGNVRQMARAVFI